VHAVEHRADVAVAEEEEVLPTTIHVPRLGPVVHDAEIERGQQVGTTQRSARMSTLYRMDLPNDIPSDLTGEAFQGAWHKA
jgi:hypothetical protein